MPRKVFLMQLYFTDNMRITSSQWKKPTEAKRQCACKHMFSVCCHRRISQVTRRYKNNRSNNSHGILIHIINKSIWSLSAFLGDILALQTGDGLHSTSTGPGKTGLCSCGNRSEIRNIARSFPWLMDKIFHHLACLKLCRYCNWIFNDIYRINWSGILSTLGLWISLVIHLKTGSQEPVLTTPASGIPIHTKCLFL